jgi:aspartate aminotransferase-like enzyme
MMTYSLLAPGPVNVHPEVLKIMSEPMIHHRTPLFDQVFGRVKQNLKPLFGTQQEIFLHTSTGSGGMESLLVNTLSAGDKVLCIVSGKFGERWAEMANAFGLQCSQINVSWGESVNPDHVLSFLQKNPDTKAVLCQACETSTAVLHPIEKLGTLIKDFSETLFLVDGITALGAMPLPMDAWHIDGLVGGSQKAFMLPTGMSLVSFSAKAWEKIPTSKLQKYYFDVRREKKSNDQGETFFSSNVILIRAMDLMLELITKHGLKNLYQNILARSQFTLDCAAAMQLTSFSKSISPSLTAIQLPAELDGQKIRLHLEKKYNVTIMGGQDQLKGKILRVGHMGYIQKTEMIRFILKLQSSLKDFGYERSDLNEQVLFEMLEKRNQGHAWL